MIVSVSFSSPDGSITFTTDVDSSTTNLEELRMIVALQFNLTDCALIVGGKPLSDLYSLKNGDLVIVRKVSAKKVSQGPRSLRDLPESALRSPSEFRRVVQAHPHLMQQLLQSDPELHSAVSSSDIAVEQVITRRQMISRESEAKRQQLEQQRALELRLASLDPLSKEYQEVLQKIIEQKNIDSNYESALDFNPESFGRVTMLYVPIQVQGKAEVAFVDSGAQMTIISKRVAERCNILRLLDTRFAGMAKGVGSAPILGKIHSAQVKLGNAFFPTSFTVLDQVEHGGIDLILGLDSLRAHQMVCAQLFFPSK